MNKMASSFQAFLIAAQRCIGLSGRRMFEAESKMESRMHLWTSSVVKDGGGAFVCEARPVSAGAKAHDCPLRDMLLNVLHQDFSFGKIRFDFDAGFNGVPGLNPLAFFNIDP